MKNKILLFLICIQLGYSCKGNNTNFNDKNLFWDGLLNQGGLQLFSLFDAYPALKSGINKLEALEFNLRLNQSLERIRPQLPDILAGLGHVFNDDQNALKRTLSFLSNEIKYLREAKPSLYSSATATFDKIRKSEGNVLPNLIPLSNLSFQELLKTKTEESISSSIQRINENLKDEDTISFLRKTEIILGKLLKRNSQTKSGLTNVLSGLLQTKSSNLFTAIFDTLGGIGEGFSYKAGIGSGFKNSGTSLKELFLNLFEYFTPSGSKFDSIYSNSKYSSQLRFFLRDLLIHVRQFIVTPQTLIKDTNDPLLGRIAEAYHQLKFTKSLPKANDSFQKMLTLDIRGRNRTLDASSDNISLLEQLLLTVGISNDFGYYWSNDPFEPQITGPSGGVLTLGDSLFSLSSKLKSVGIVVRNASANVSSTTLSLNNADLAIQVGDSVFGIGISNGTTVSSVANSSVQLSNATTAMVNDQAITFKRNTSISNLGISAAIWNSAISGRVQKNGQVERINLNTPVLSRIENEGFSASTNDPIYTKTLPWILKSISSTIYGGQGPYFNKNRKNKNGEIETLDGRIYKDSSGNDLIYKQEWNTSRYKILVKNSENGEVRYVSLGGRDFPNTDTGNGTHYHISEISIPDSEREVNDDEEAFYKNFTWLMYKKRFVIVVPVALEALGSTVQDAVYIVIVSNGLKGLIDVKPFCNEFQCSEFDSGKWLKANYTIKNDIKAFGDLQNFSNIPGDSCFLVEVWGYGISPSADDVLGFVDDTTFQQVYRLILSKFNVPNEFYGPIPPAIAAGFPSLERLGFLSQNIVPPESTSSHWETRNHILPLVSSLAHALVQTSDSSSNKSSFPLLTNLVETLNRPFLFEAVDPTAAGDTEDTASPNRNVLIKQYRIRGNSGSFGMRSPNMPNFTLYYPNSELRSHLSFLIENQRKWNDGILNALSKGSFIESLFRSLYEWGNPELKTNRNLSIIGLQQIAFEAKLETESPTVSQFSIDRFSFEVENYVSSLILERGRNISHPNYSFIDDIETFFSTILNSKSSYSYTNSLRQATISLSEVELSSTEIFAMIDWVGLLFTSEEGNQRGFFITLLTAHVPELLDHLKGKSLPLIQILETLTANSSFLQFFYTRVQSDFSSNAIFEDWERFFMSSMIQQPSRDKNDLLYNISQTCNIFSQVLRAPQRPMQTDYWFVDQVNRQNELSIFDNLNFLFSKK
ncbi:hypothetical protein LPTSP4_19360 [Leptospira ryugenii]|uniref:Lipoprotein n=1 Tax=Leptospira ryugenii TaxID=1917863 RepID=A0A2P2E0K5_9LEPT|nr:hypothetical protein [Leptospira ryugenii]GBF50411.1 hypothetical protein LPTSP4_19360 [Leptospira ryugenii]